MLIGIQEIEQKYEILTKLGEGGMGAIYKARHKLLDELRVIKTIRPQLQGDEDLQKRFLREAQVAAKMRHSSIATLHDFAFTDDGTAYIVMELIEGQNMRDYQRAGGRLSVHQVVDVARQGLDALGYLHQRSFVHRDISTDNMMLSFENGRPRVTLIDLGLAKSLEGSQWRTKTGMVVGKVRYISPEQLNSGVEGVQVDARSDLYSFGVVVYELLTGEFPITGDDDMSLIAGHLYREPRPFEETDPNAKIPAALRTVVMKALQKKAECRYATANEFATALEQAASGQSTAMLELGSDEMPTTRIDASTVDAAGNPFRPTATVGVPLPQATQPALAPGDAPFTRPAVPQPVPDGPQTLPMPTDPAHYPATEVISGEAPTALSLPVDAARVQAPAPTTAPPVAAAPPAPRSSPQGRWLPAVALLLVAIAVGLYFSRGRASHTQTAPSTAASAGAGDAGEAPADIFWGSYHAVVIGNNGYSQLPQLESAVIDAQAVADVLERRYGFTVTLVENADRKTLMNSIRAATEDLTGRDNLLVYYAGHGALVNRSQYWQGVEAAPGNSAMWISTKHEVASLLDQSSARHVLVVSDSCFAGAVASGELVNPELEGLSEEDRIRQLATRPSRLVLASGGLAPVLDRGAAGRHSVFAQAFLDALRSNEGPLAASTLFEQVRSQVGASVARLSEGVEQEPVLAPMPSKVDQGGELFFVPQAPAAG
ncbi:MAG: protein kinase [Acidobacteriota bacterium]